MKIGVFGCGYVGLVTAAVLADMENRVVAFDIDSNKINALRNGECPIFEPGLAEVLHRTAASGLLSFTTQPEEAIHGQQMVILAVGTPTKPDGTSDLTYLQAAASTVARYAIEDLLVVNKSTAPVGSVDAIRRWIEAGLDKRMPTAGITRPIIEVASNPEFLREGIALKDAIDPDRIVVGINSRKAAALLEELYSNFKAPLLVTDPASAEMIKYAANCYLALKISFANSLADLCEAMGGDAAMVTRGVGLDRRIGPAFLNAGLGYGGSCLPKDIRSFIYQAQEVGRPFGLLEAAEKTNADRVPHLLGKLQPLLGDFRGKVIALWGLAFKPDTDDIRDAKSLEIIEQLKMAGAILQVHDPQAMDNVRRLHPHLSYCATPQQAAKGADAIILVTEWKDYARLDLEVVGALMRHRILIDGRNLFTAKLAHACGFLYRGVGQQEPNP